VIALALWRATRHASRGADESATPDSRPHPDH
jgi:hypothetical protein